MGDLYRQHLLRQHRGRIAEHQDTHRTGAVVRFSPVDSCVKCGERFEAELRYLCARCEGRLDGLVAEIPGLLEHLRSGDAKSEVGRRKPGAGTPLGAAWLAADELESVFEGWLRRTGQGWAGHPLAGDMLTELSQLVSEARRKWPLEVAAPAPRHLGILKCSDCQIAELYEYEPTYVGQPMTFRCHGKCGRVLDQDQYERLLKLASSVAKRNRRRARVKTTTAQ